MFFARHYEHIFSFLLFYRCAGGSGFAEASPIAKLRGRGSDVTNDIRSLEVEGNIGPFKIVHIGDSYSSGTGVGVYNGPFGCYRSNLNGGSRYAAKLKEQDLPVRYINRACSGGVTAHYFSNRMFDETNILKPVPIDDEVIEEGVLTWHRMVKPQMHSISNNVDMVIMNLEGMILNSQPWRSIAV